MTRLVLAILSACVPLLAVAEEKDQYLVQFKMLLLNDDATKTLRGENMTVQTEKSQTPPPPQDAAGASNAPAASFAVLSGKTELLDGTDVLLRVDQHTLDYSGAEKKHQLSVLSAPQVVTHSGVEAIVEIKQDCGQLQYFEKNKDGSYQLKSLTSGDWLGMELKLKVNGAENTADVNIELRSQAQREKLENVQLDVGKPTLEAQRIAINSVKYTDGHWILVISPTQKEKKLLIAFRIEKITSKDRQNPKPKADF